MPDGTPRLFSLRALAPIVAAAALLAGCDTAEGPSLFDPIEEGEYQSRVDPVLTGIAPPPGQALAGVTTLTLTGSHFAPSLDSTFVYFDGQRAEALTVTPTEITVLAPNMPRPGLEVKVSVLRSENFSQALEYELLPAIERVDPDLGNNDDPRAVTTDEVGNVYYNRRTFTPAGSSPSGIVRVDPDGAVTDFSSVAQPFTDFEVLDGTLLGARGVGAVFSVGEGSDRAAPTYIMSQLDASGLNPLSIDAASDGALWAAGVGEPLILRIDSDGTSETAEIVSDDPVEVVDLEARDDFLYLVVTFGAASAEVRPSRIVRYPLADGRIAGPFEVFYDVSAAYPALRATSMAFAADGSLFAGLRTVSTIAADEAENVVPLIQIEADGSEASVFFDGLMQGVTYGIEWLDEGGTILVVSGPRLVADPVSLGRRADVLFVNTLVEGER